MRGAFTCYFCDKIMDELEDGVLVCPKCGHSVEIEDWVSEPELYEELYGQTHAETDDENYWAPNEDFPGEGFGEEDDYDDIYEVHP